MKLMKNKTTKGYVLYRITIPNALIKALGLVGGEEFDFKVEGKNLRMVKRDGTVSTEVKPVDNQPVVDGVAEPQSVVSNETGQ